MGIRTDQNLRQQFIFYTLILMLASLLVSRAALSVSMILFLIVACIHKNFLQQFFSFLRNKFLLGISFLFFIFFISGLWSDDKHAWLQIVRLKLPLFLLPLAFAGQWQLSSRQWKIIAIAFLCLCFAGCCWSFFQYFKDVQAIEKSYLEAKSIPTPLENDHVRFSLLVCIAVIVCAVLYKEIMISSGKIILVAAGIFFIIYLHVLAARTGLFAFYIFLLLWLVHLFSTSKKRKWIFVLVLIILPVAAWICLPTFRNRVHYIVYDFSYVNKNQYLPGANDGSRILSLKAGWSILKQHPFGIGGGDIFYETNNWYNTHVPNMLVTDKYYPSSEWLLYGDAAGWIGVLLFTIIMLLPFFEKIKRYNFFWIALNIIMAFSLMFDIGLEVQFGVFIYGFIILWWWKWLSSENLQQAISL